MKMSEPILYHRGEAFRSILSRVHCGLQYVFQTSQPVFILTSSGTGAMEAAVANLFSPDDEVICINGGKFGERWSLICTAFRLKVHEIQVEWGSAVTPERIARELENHPDTKGIFLTHCETSTGVLTDIESICLKIRDRFNGLIVVDAVTSLCVDEFRFDEWGIDCAIGGSQKAFMIPPGLSFIALSTRAWESAGHATSPRFYFDLFKAKTALGRGDTPWTPAITLVSGLAETLKKIKAETLEKKWQRHKKISEEFRSAVRRTGLELIGAPKSHSLTVIAFPDGVDFVRFQKCMSDDFGIIFSGGQGQFTGKVFRISHLGNSDLPDIVFLTDAIILSLKKCGWKNDSDFESFAAPDDWNSYSG